MSLIGKINVFLSKKAMVCRHCPSTRTCYVCGLLLIIVSKVVECPTRASDVVEFDPNLLGQCPPICGAGRRSRNAQQMNKKVL